MNQRTVCSGGATRSMGIAADGDWGGERPIRNLVVVRPALSAAIACKHAHKSSVSAPDRMLDGVRATAVACRSITRTEFANTPEASKALNAKPGPMIIISASGMATDGRVVHHLKAFAPEPKNLILFSGFQAGGTRGANMLAGAETIRIHGTDIPVRAEVANLETLSAHANYVELIDWLRAFEKAPRNLHLIHSEPAAMRKHIEKKIGWECSVPDYKETVTIR